MGFRHWLMTPRFSITSRNPITRNTPGECAGTTRILASSGQIKIQLFPHEISLSQITCDEKGTCHRRNRICRPSLRAFAGSEGLRGSCCCSKDYQHRPHYLEFLGMKSIC